MTCSTTSPKALCAATLTNKNMSNFYTESPLELIYFNLVIISQLNKTKTNFFYMLNLWLKLNDVLVKRISKTESEINTAYSTLWKHGKACV